MRKVLLFTVCFYIRTQCMLVRHGVPVNSAPKKPARWEIVKGKAQRKKTVPTRRAKSAVRAKPVAPVEHVVPVVPVTPILPSKPDEQTETADAEEPEELTEALETATSDEPSESTDVAAPDEDIDVESESHDALEPYGPTESFEDEITQPLTATDARESSRSSELSKLSQKVDGVSMGNTISPYTPQSGWKYYLEAGWSQAWPTCEKRFVSHTRECGEIDLSYDYSKKLFEFEATTGQGFYIKTSCNTYLSYSSNCSNHNIDSWTTASAKQEFEFVRADQPFAWAIKAKGRKECNAQWVSFPATCESSNELRVFKLHSSPGLGFRLHPDHHRENMTMLREPVTKHSCADPFAWYTNSDHNYHLLCTGGNFDLLRSARLGSNIQFEPEGVALARDVEVPGWAGGGERWAAEIAELGQGDNVSNILFFSVDQREEGYKHRIGWAVSHSQTPKPGSYMYGKTPLNLGGEAGGDVDQTVFKDDNGVAYLLWKTDDEWVGSTTTRIWAQEISWENNDVVLVGAKDVLMDSGGLWWINGITPGSAIVEAPEIIKRNGYYYLFFSAGFFCTSHYSEGVARSENFWGPYEKLQVPFISTALVGHWGKKKLLGPGHATFLQDNMTGDHYVVYHAHFEADDHCAGNSKQSSLSVVASRQMRDSGRYSFIDRMGFTYDGWPYIMSCNYEDGSCKL